MLGVVQRPGVRYAARVVGGSARAVEAPERVEGRRRCFGYLGGGERCSTILSAYNLGVLCSACARAEREVCVAEEPCVECMTVADAAAVLGYSQSTVVQYMKPGHGKLDRCEECGHVVEESVLELREANDAKAGGSGFGRRVAGDGGVAGGGGGEEEGSSLGEVASSSDPGDVDGADGLRVESAGAEGAVDGGGVPADRGDSEGVSEGDDDDHRHGPVVVPPGGLNIPKPEVPGVSPELFEKALANRLELFGVLPPAPPPEFDPVIAYAWGRVAGCVAAFGDDIAVAEIAAEIDGLGRVLVDQLVLPRVVLGKEQV